MSGCGTRLEFDLRPGGGLVSISKSESVMAGIKGSVRGSAAWPGGGQSFGCH